MIPALKKHLVAGTLTALLCMAFAVCIASQPASPGPHLSDSVSFNEKAKWLRHHLNDQNCDIVVLGSSMALNNFNADSFRSRWPSKIINTGFWGASPGDALSILRTTLKICTPKLILFPTYFGDYIYNNQKLDFDSFTKFLLDDSITSLIYAYAHNVDLKYFIDNALRSRQANYRDRLLYASLNFDWSGGVGLACQNFIVDSNRWDGHRSFSPLPQPLQESIDAIGELARLAKAHGALFIVAVTPMRLAAEEALPLAPIMSLWEKVEGVIRASEGYFFRGRTEQFNDSLFTDFAHLNICGAKKWTAALLTEFNSTISQRVLSNRR